MVGPLAIGEIARTLPDTIDVFVCSSSFEERCVVLPRALANKRIKRVLVCSNIDQRTLVGGYARELGQAFRKSVVVDFDSGNPLTIADSLLKHLRVAAKDARNIVVDTTTFTHEALLIMYKILSDSHQPGPELIFLYNPAIAYSYHAVTKDEVWLTKGLRDWRGVLGYPGEFDMDKAHCLVVMVGYEYERSKLLIDLIEPNLLVLGKGKEGESVNLEIQEVNSHKYERLKVMFREVREFDFSCVDPQKSAGDIAAGISDLQDFNITIAPMNNKLSTLGLGLLCRQRSDIRVVASRANLYNKDCYSKPSDQCYVYRSPSLE